MSKLSDLLEKLKGGAAADLKETVAPGDAKSLMLARLKSINPLVDDEAISSMEAEPGAAKGAQSLEDLMAYTPYGVAGRPDIGAAVAQFLPQAAGAVVGEMAGGAVLKGAGKLAGKGLDKIKALWAERSIDPKLMQAAKAADAKLPNPRQALIDKSDDMINQWLAKEKPIMDVNAPHPLTGKRTSIGTGDMSKLSQAEKEIAINEVEAAIRSPQHRALAAESRVAAEKNAGDMFRDMIAKESLPPAAPKGSIDPYATTKPNPFRKKRPPTIPSK